MYDIDYLINRNGGGKSPRIQTRATLNADKCPTSPPQMELSAPIQMQVSAPPL